MDSALKSGIVVTLDTCGRSCALCGNPSKLQRCGRCYRVFYCSKDCQRHHWKKHRDLCQQICKNTPFPSTGSSSADGDAPMQENIKPDCSGDAKNDSGMGDDSFKPPDICKACRRSGQSFKTCSRCSEATYCTKDCQRADWKRHKKECNTRAKSQAQKDYEAGLMFKDLACQVDPRLATSSGHRPTLTTLSWKQAMARARELNPGKVVLCKLSDVSLEEDLDPYVMNSTVFLARLAKPHFYVFRHAWYLEDIKGKEERLFFYLDHGEPRPHFQWSQLQVGHYICLEHAYIHTFLDCTSGIRVDDARDVAIIQN